MKFDELRAKVEATIPSSHYPLGWSDTVDRDGQLQTEANFTIVPLSRGRFTIYRTDGRGIARRDIGGDSRPLVFATEDAVCDYVWARLSEPPAPDRPYIAGDPKRLAEQRRKLDAQAVERESGHSWFTRLWPRR